MLKIKVKYIIIFLIIFCSCNNFNNPTDGIKIEGNIENSQDCSHISGIRVNAYNYADNYLTKISESKYENNYFSLFLPYELKNKYCSAINEWGLFDTKFESYLTISNKNVKISKISLWSINEEHANDIQQFGYAEMYNNDIVSVTLVKTKYIYAQSAVSIKGEYESYVAGTEKEGIFCPKTVKVDLLLQKGWNIIYNIGNFVPKPNTDFWVMNSATLNITTAKPENIELKWYYNCALVLNILRNNTHYLFQPYMGGYDTDFIINQY